MAPPTRSNKRASKPGKSSAPTTTMSNPRKQFSRASRKSLNERIQNVYEDSDEEDDFRAKTADDVGGALSYSVDTVASSDDEEIDEDEAFNSDDEERFADFKFYNPSDRIAGKKRKLRGDSDDDSDDGAESDGLSVGDNRSDDDAESDEDDDADMMDLSEMLASGTSVAPTPRRVTKLAGPSFMSRDELPSDDSDDGDADMADADDDRDLAQLLAPLLDPEAAKPSAKKKRRVEERTEAYDEGEFALPGREHAQLDLGTLLGALSEEKEFGKLKKQALDLRRDHAESKTESAPLPARLQAKLERQAAYATAKEDVDKWQNIVERNKNLKTLHFPLQAEKPSSTTARLVAEFKPATELDAAIGDVMKQSTFNELEVAQELPHNALDPEEVRRRQKELQLMRELAFRHEQKAKRHAKIKSKSFRKIQKKERTKQQEAELQHMLESDPDAAREHLIKMELERAKSRVTLKAKSRSKWAHFLQANGGDEQLTREMIVEQMQEEEDLQRQIRGSKGEDEDGGASDVEMDARGVGAEAEAAPQKGLFGMKFMVKAQEARQKALDEADRDDYDGVSDSDKPLPGRRVIGKKTIKSAAPEMDVVTDVTFDVPNTFGDADEEVDEGANPWTQAHSGAASKDKDSAGQKLGKLQRKQQKILESAAKAGQTEEDKPKLNMDVGSVTRVDLGNDDNDGSDAEPSGDGRKIVFQQQDLVAMAFAGDDVVREFEDEKEALVESEAPQEVDMTLPGWGSWGGTKIAPKANVVVKKVAGTAKTARKDAKMGHVIISERRQKKIDKYMATSLPQPFQSKEQYELAMQQTIGKEWVTAESLRSMTAPKVQVAAGAVIEPLRFIKQDADDWAAKKEAMKKEAREKAKEAREKAKAAKRGNAAKAGKAGAGKE
ncbi:hypothetical protein AMAG_04583 [Allomyces macrogynus ATCC 38327]|uniref:Uncharacterized protein n=1 Tax=Allomyces macrogynus (strain ATCC 38327) TaxID=578462 RepID=A0A0L0S5T1_ALLM3|nr:hypothetical protein AMAG_04583 [Allomyces macrogynus ATCC 38327]|eukprot:KNE57724.1 hypothetical protein AMAG_04583 [Allomyces macrogynus ATCC 38327]